MGIASELKAVAELADKYPEMRQLIFKIQADAMDLQEQLREKSERVHELEDEIARLKAWDKEKGKYELRDLALINGDGGAFAYVSLTGTVHALCPNCFDEGRKSVLQSNGEPQIHKHRFQCIKCKNQVAATSNQLAKTASEARL